MFPWPVCSSHIAQDLGAKCYHSTALVHCLRFTNLPWICPQRNCLTITRFGGLRNPRYPTPQKGFPLFSWFCIVFHCFSLFFIVLHCFHGFHGFVLFSWLVKELDLKELDFKELNFKKLDFKKLGTWNLVPEIWYLNYWDCSWLFHWDWLFRSIGIGCSRLSISRSTRSTRNTRRTRSARSTRGTRSTRGGVGRVGSFPWEGPPHFFWLNKVRSVTKKVPPHIHCPRQITNACWRAHPARTLSMVQVCMWSVFGRGWPWKPRVQGRHRSAMAS